MSAAGTTRVSADRLAVYLVLDPDYVAGDLVETLHAALDGGVTAVQLRAKGLPDRPHLALAEEVRGWCRAFQILFFVNDRLDLALACGADGVHLGVDDLPLPVARRLGGDRLILGYSPDTDGAAAAAAHSGADYLGVGPVFGTVSKPDAGEAIGLATLHRRATFAGIPTVGIGGITPANASSVVAAGAAGVAVVGAILGADDPRRAASALASAVASAHSGNPCVPDR